VNELLHIYQKAHVRVYMVYINIYDITTMYIYLAFPLNHKGDEDEST